MIDSYRELRARVDAFAALLSRRYEEELRCGPSCADCCQAGLTITLIEAVAIGMENGAEEAQAPQLAGKPPIEADGQCRLLSPENLCAVYDSRPLICRTHGLPLKYPGAREPVACEKNFLSNPLESDFAFDMNNLETALFAVNLAYCRQKGLDPMARVALDRLAILLKLRKE